MHKYTWKFGYENHTTIIHSQFITNTGEVTTLAPGRKDYNLPQYASVISLLALSRTWMLSSPQQGSCAVGIERFAETKSKVGDIDHVYEWLVVVEEIIIKDKKQFHYVGAFANNDIELGKPGDFNHHNKLSLKRYFSSAITNYIHCLHKTLSY